MARKQGKGKPASTNPRPAQPLAMSAQDAYALVRTVKSAAITLARVAASPQRFNLLSKPKRIGRSRRIHPRRLPPMIVEGAEHAEFSTSAPLAFAAPRAAAAPAARAATDAIVVTRHTELTEAAAQNTAGNVGEPSVAVNGQLVLYTGNWYAALSADAGATFRFMNPGQFDTARFEFCCDQVALYLAPIDTFVWLLQYGI